VRRVLLLLAAGCAHALPDDQACTEVGYAIAARTEACTGDVDAAVARYAKTHKKRLRPHFKLTSDYSTGRPFNAFERLLYAAAPHDPVVANAFWRYGTRNASPNVLLSPRVLLHALRARRRTQRQGTVPGQRAATDQPAKVS
jgi:hypothetical protein